MDHSPGGDLSHIKITVDMAKAGCGCDIPYCRKLTLEINAT